MKNQIYRSKKFYRSSSTAQHSIYVTMQNAHGIFDQSHSNWQEANFKPFEQRTPTRIFNIFCRTK